MGGHGGSSARGEDRIRISDSQPFNGYFSGSETTRRAGGREREARGCALWQHLMLQGMRVLETMIILLM
jgi:hypothetical protein